MMLCPFCGSYRLQLIGGNAGDPFELSPKKVICLDCGRVLYGDPEDEEDIMEEEEYPRE